MKTRKLSIGVLGVIAVLALGSCSSDSETITVDGAWARTSPMNTELGAVYMNITAAEDDALVSATVDSSVAMSASVHETTMNADGTMAMQEVEKVALPAGTAVSFEPGGYHIMLMGLNQPLSLGDTVTVTLTFESGESVSVDAEVRDQAP